MMNVSETKTFVGVLDDCMEVSKFFISTVYELPIGAGTDERPTLKHAIVDVRQ